MSAPESSGPIAPGCTRWLEIDVAEFLRHAAEPTWRDFREHYPRCPDCAAEVRAWTAVEATLSAGGSSHPAPELLWRFQSRSSELSTEQKATVEQHLQGCPSCRDELAALGRFDPAAVRASAPPPARRRASAFAAWWERLRGVVWHPAFAYALVLLILLPMLGRVREDARRAPLPVAKQEAVAPAAKRAAPPRPLTNEAASRPAAAPPAKPLADRDAPLGAVAGSGAGEAVAKRQPRDELATASQVFAKGKADRKDAPPPAQFSVAEEAPAAREAKSAEREQLAAAPPVVAMRRQRAEEADAGPLVERRRAAAGPLVIDLAVTRTVTLADRTRAAEVVLRLARPAQLPVDGSGWIRLRSADGARELREPLPPGAPVELHVPTAWLRSGAYQFEVGVEPGGAIDSRTVVVE